ncbi:archaetidylserine decarboxylase [Echinimonas agarilytica]|uniref:Phosphatidylserine decarboxylase proenzyme n=1 Tax=Echinimonas agarilytica TaxID=1215918 RepID=A0AA41W426_9GAMM|nr:archaetidylserine decarboxylase [Echinimonas agarilytica]MCM2678450.1 archaetidylserine decarboxylase [Echinimonas agarilytica]
MDSLKVALQYCFPQHGLSRVLGKLAAAKAGTLTTSIIRWFIGKYKVNMSEALHEDPAHFDTFNDFFTRELKPGARPIDQDVKSLVHPADGAVSQCGPIDQDRIFQAKGHDYTTQALLGGESALAEQFKKGSFITTYLSPTDYHRVHMPFSGTLRRMIYVPGKLFSVNPLTAQNVPGLFARNERVVCIFDTEIGPMALVLVGATIVASMETVWAGTITPPAGKSVFSWQYPATGNTAVHLEKGDEMGRFKLGSTTVLLFSEDAIEFAESVTAEAPTRMGEVMAHTTGRSE